MRGSIITFLIVVAAGTVGATGSATGDQFQAQHATSRSYRTANVPLLPRGPWVLKGHASAMGSRARVDALGTLFIPRHVAFTIASRPPQRAHLHWYVLCNDRRADNETHTEATTDVQLPVGRVPPMPRSLGGPCTLYVSMRLFRTGTASVKIYGY